MMVKEFLNRVRREKGTLDVYLRRRKMLECEIFHAGYHKMGVLRQQKQKRSMQESIVERLEREDLRIQKQYVRLIENREMAERIISFEADAVRRNILMRRYILSERWEVISREMGYEIHYLFRLHGSSLRSLEKKIQKDTFLCGKM